MWSQFNEESKHLAHQHTELRNSTSKKDSTIYKLCKVITV